MSTQNLFIRKYKTFIVKYYTMKNLIKTADNSQFFRQRLIGTSVRLLLFPLFLVFETNSWDILATLASYCGHLNKISYSQFDIHKIPVPTHLFLR